MALTSGKPLTELYNKRVRNNQDLLVLIDDHHNRRGTGKTVLSLGLAEAMDRTDEGLTAAKCAISPDVLIDNYTSKPRGSSLVLDEAEVSTSKYEAGTATNRAIRELTSMGRIEQKYVFLNCPNMGEIDRDLKALVDVWIMVEEKGRAIVHFVGYNPYKEHALTPKVQELRWTDLTDDRLRAVYDELTAEKRAHLRGDGDTGTQMIDTDDHEQEVQQAVQRAEKETRDEYIRRLAETTDLSQEDIGDVVGLSRSRVADILAE